MRVSILKFDVEGFFREPMVDTDPEDNYSLLFHTGNKKRKCLLGGSNAHCVRITGFGVS